MSYAIAVDIGLDFFFNSFYSIGHSAQFIRCVYANRLVICQGLLAR